MNMLQILHSKKFSICKQDYKKFKPFEKRSPILQFINNSITNI